MNVDRDEDSASRESSITTLRGRGLEDFREAELLRVAVLASSAARTSNNQPGSAALDPPSEHPRRPAPRVEEEEADLDEVSQAHSSFKRSQALNSSRRRKGAAGNALSATQSVTSPAVASPDLSNSAAAAAEGAPPQESSDEDELQPLLDPLPDELVLIHIIAPYLEEAEILFVLPLLSRAWQAALTSPQSSSYFWRCLCRRAWTPLVSSGFPHVVNPPPKLHQLGSEGTVVRWRDRFFARPRLRLTGTYHLHQIYYRYTGPRTMWTPAGIEAVQETHYWRLFAFFPEGRLIYAHVPTSKDKRALDNLRTAMRRARSRVTWEPEDDSHLRVASQLGFVQDGVTFFKGHYHILVGETEVNGSRAPRRVLTCRAKIPLKLHWVEFDVRLNPGGASLSLLAHSSCRYQSFASETLRYALPSGGESARTFVHRYEDVPRD